MKIRSSKILIGICFMLIMGCNPKENNVEVNKVKEVLNSYFSALNASDVEKVLKVYDEQGVFMAPDFPAFSGLENIREAYTTIFGQIKLTVDLVIHDVTIAGEYAFAYTESKGTVTIKANGAVTSENNKELFVLKKTSEGWKIRQYAFNKIGQPK